MQNRVNYNTCGGGTTVALSIVVPVYNVQEYIADCLESLIYQNVQSDRYEIICIDDGSTDDCGKIIDEYAGKHAHIQVVHTVNRGVSSARNLGIQMARGEYIWFVDSDDFIVRNSLRDLIDCVETNAPDILFVKPIAVVCETGMQLTKYKAGTAEEDETTKQYNDWLWTRVIKREVIMKSGIRFDPNVSLAEDHLFCTLLNPYIKKIEHIDKIRYCYRIRPNSLSTTASKDKIDKLINACSVFWKYKNEGIIDSDLAINQVREYMIVIMDYCARLPRVEARIIVKQLKDLELFPLSAGNGKVLQDLKHTEMTVDNRRLLYLKSISYTLYGYYSLRWYRFWLKIKRRLFISRR